MRPIELTVAGLHSFREKQVIRFDELAGSGVFGIFGPTGSGKSSLLDAMTLALFGKVERAANNTQGIMNHAEDRLSVSFTFELGGKKCYRTERSYKRSGEVSLQTTTCRMVEIGGGETVLADKERDVTQAVRDLLGLTNDDFTRAVVLPQGKFAEFLSLKGKERRQMLQRLFHLERYGDRLTERLKIRTDKAQGKFDKITAEQQGLGDASGEALEKAKVDFEDAKQAVEQSRKKLLDTQKRYEQYKQLWQWQQERQTAEEELNQLGEGQAAIEQLESRLQQAREADRMKPYFQELERAEAEQKEWQRKSIEAEKALQTAEAEYEKIKQTYEKAKAERTDKEPKLLVREEQLKQAKNKQQELQIGHDELNVLKQQLAESEQQQQQTQKQLSEDETLHKKWLESQQELKKQLEEQTVAHDKREKVRQANEAAQTIENIRKSLAELTQEHGQKQTELEKLERTLAKHEQSHTHRLEDIQRSFFKTSDQYNEVCEAERRVEKALAVTDKAIFEEEQKREEAREQELALTLAEHLQDSEPCPVCGSIHHPAPVAAANRPSAKDSSKLDSLRKAKERGSSLLHEIGKLKWQLEQLSDRLSEWLTDPYSQTDGNPTNQNGGSHRGKMDHPLQTAKGETASSHEEQETIGDNSFDHFSEVAAHQMDEGISGDSVAVTVQGIEVEYKGYRQDIIALEKKSKQLLGDIRNLEKQRDEAATRTTTSKQNITELTEKLESGNRELTEKEALWQETFPDFTLDAIQLEQKNINKADRETEELQQRIEKSVPVIDKKASQIETLKKDRQQMEIRVAEQKTAVYSQQKSVADLKNRLYEQIGTDDADQLLADTTKTLASLKQTENEQYDAWQKADKTRQEQENTTTAARESYEQTKKRWLVAQESGTEQLSHTSFTQIENAKQAVTTDTEQQKWQQEIEEFYDRQKALQNEQKRLNQLITERQISEKDWHSAQNEHQASKEKYDEMLERRGNAKQRLNEIETRHARFNQLEEQRKEVATLLERLNKLRKVFQGNGFVEFVAEEQLMQVTRDASARLGNLTRQRYAIEVDSNGGFVMRDNANGGVRRPVTTLSGGETFLTSLALALSLSSQIQLRGQYPLEFFFLDEGFGTLDQELLDTVVTALEQLHVERFSVGVISHVPELRARLPVRLIVKPPEPSGAGSRTHIEKL